MIECRTDVWHQVRDKSRIGMVRWLGLLARLLSAYPLLIWRYLRLPKHDWVLLGYPAIPDVFVIRLFAWLRGAGVAMDWFLSAYDTVVQDRRMVERKHPLAMLLWSVEWLAVRAADTVFMDTDAHARRMERMFGLQEGRCRSVWVGVERDAFTLRGNANHDGFEGDGLRVLFYGQFIPLHGASTIVEAARLLRDEPVQWLMIGSGQESAQIRRQLDAQPLPRLRWLEWVAYEQLIEHIAAAELCLGIFGISDKAGSVIPNKVFQAIAAGKPIATRDSPAIRELLAHSPPCAYLVAANDPVALAATIRTHAAARRAAFETSCHAELSPRIDAAAIGGQLERMLLAYPVGRAAR